MKTKINILYIFHVSEIGGGSFCLLNIIKYLDKSIYNPIVLLKKEGSLSTELQKIGVKVYFEKSITTVLYNKNIFKISSLLQICNLFSSLTNIKKMLLEIKPDILHLNTMMLYPYLLPASQLKIKTVIHMRENWPKEEHRLQFKLAKKFISKYSDQIVAINQTSANILGLHKKTVIIHDYISFENRSEYYDFEQLFGKNYKSLKIFSYFGGKNWQKGALQVVETFVSKIKNDDIRLLVVGGNNKKIIFKGFKGRIKKLLAKMNYYRYRDKLKFIAQKDDRIVFVPSTYQVKSIIEQSVAVVSFFTIPHANLTMAEASCLGTPSIAANTPEAKEYSNNGNSALLFEMNNKNDLVEKINYFLTHSIKCTQDAEKGIENMNIIFSPKVNSKLLNNLYHQLIDPNNLNK